MLPGWPGWPDTGALGNEPIPSKLRLTEFLPHPQVSEELASICDCPGSPGGQSCVLMRRVEGKKRGKDPFLYWAGRDLKKPSLLAPVYTEAPHPLADTKAHISTHGYRCTQRHTHTHTHTQKDTQRYEHTHTRYTHGHRHAHQ